ncbi:iron ABC transporter permease [Pasteurellaceae bacterium 20609_3]|uniref:ABC transporter permease n=1 Tax=Spirabiliibacterium mucosae TaxID=28156 RepID=UPI001AAD0FDD|nr:iron ABC transporter permease [Spirabiliibacterium mucosae]MBE2898537.1 iron ABC transporter permease [Spirabiliibacterium mucosae]
MNAIKRSALWLLLAAFVLPIFAIGYQALSGDAPSMSHLWQTVMAVYIQNSLLLVLGTVALSVLFALPCSYWLSLYHFPTSRVLQWLLCLPLALPPYLLGYLYTDLLDYPGPVQRFLRATFGWSSSADYFFPNIRSLGGACVVLALVLYPYLFLLTRIAFMDLSQNLHHSAKLLGVRGWALFRKVTLPMIRPAIATGCALVAMETLGDFGTVSYFAVPTLTTAIYDTWLVLGDLASASRISLLMLTLVFALLAFERYSRRLQKRYQRGFEQPITKVRLRGWRLWLALAYCWGLIACAVMIPLAKLLYWAYFYFEQSWQDAFWRYAFNSVKVSAFAAILSVLTALLLLFFVRKRSLNQRPSASTAAVVPLASMGYAIPGTVLGIGLLIPLTGADHLLNHGLKSLGLPLLGLIFSGSIFALVYAYIIRFSVMSLGSINAALDKIPPSLDMAANTLGVQGVKMRLRVHFPLLRKGILTALILVFLESMKELNASLLLRPFNFDTLATHVFTLTSDEQLEQASLSALFLVLVGMVPVIFLTRAMLSKRHGS